LKKNLSSSDGRIDNKANALLSAQRRIYGVNAEAAAPGISVRWP
jgi:hypothetical protein